MGDGKHERRRAADQPDLAIVDAHHHLINLQTLRYPWIEDRSPALEALLDNYYDIAHDYDVGAYLSDVADNRLIHSVACEFGAADHAAEARWAQACSERSGFPHAFIAGIDLTSATVAETLTSYEEIPIVNAVRQPLYWSEDPLKRLGARPNYLSDPAWLRGFEQVAARGFVWDLLVYDEQLPSAHGLIRSFPETPIVLEAIGWPLDQTDGGFQRWYERLQAVSQFPNVTIKLQGLALLFKPSTEALQRWVRAALQIFGPSRCMFASHFPVDRLLWSFEELLGSMRTIVGGLSLDEQRSFFSGCARRQYRIC